ncbi:MAG: NUDIX domain-containing protein [Anaerolineales bacterium]
MYQTLAKRIIAQNPWYTLRQDDVRLPDGQETVYNVITKPNAVWIVPLLSDGQIVLIDQYRYTIDTWCLEIPAGGMLPGDTPEGTAARELGEEIGGTARELVLLGTFWTMNGIGDELGYMYLARDVTLGAPQREATEMIRQRSFPAADAVAMARAGQVPDAQSALALLLCEPYL